MFITVVVVVVVVSSHNTSSHNTKIQDNRLRYKNKVPEI